MIMSYGVREESVCYYSNPVFSWASLLLEAQITEKVSLYREFEFYSWSTHFQYKIRK